MSPQQAQEQVQYPNVSQFKDQIQIESIISDMSFFDRLRILFKGSFIIQGVIATENKVGNCQGQFVVNVRSVVAPRTYKAI